MAPKFTPATRRDQLRAARQKPRQGMTGGERADFYRALEQRHPDHEWVVHGTRGGGQTGKLYVRAADEKGARREAMRRWGRGRGIKITKVQRVS